MIYVFIASLLFASLYLLYFKKHNKKRHFKDIPYPSAISWPILGHAPSILISPIQKIKEWHKEAGPIYRINMGSQQWTIISDPYLAYDVFVTAGDTTWSRPYHYFSTEVHALGNRGLTANTNGLSWENNRKSAVNTLKPESITRFSSTVTHELQDLMSRLEDMAEKKEAFDPWHHIVLTVLNITCTIVCAKRFDDIKDPEFQAVSKLIDDNAFYFGAVGDLASFFPQMFWLEKVFRLKKKMKIFSQNRSCLLKSMISEAYQKEENSLVKELYLVKNEEETLSEDDILVLVDDLISGSETITTMLCWTLAVLSQNYETQQKIIQELDRWKSMNPTQDFPCFKEDRESFLYSICVQKEILRLCPPAPLGFPHACTKDTIVNGYFIPKDAVLISDILSMNRAQDLYEDAESFKPERFLKKTTKSDDLTNAKVKEKDHFSFGLGKRVCPAIYMPELDVRGNPIKTDPLKPREHGIQMKPFLTKFRLIPRV